MPTSCRTSGYGSGSAPVGTTSSTTRWARTSPPRGARLDEQIDLLRRLWAEPLVTFHGRFDQLERACINPRPRRQIPIWVGGFSEPAYRRGGRLGDGFTFAGDVDAAVDGMGRVRHHLAEAGRAADGFGFELVATRARSAAEVVEAAERWEAAGGTHLCVLTIKLGLDTAAAHLDYASTVKQALDARLGAPG